MIKLTKTRWSKISQIKLKSLTPDCFFFFFLFFVLFVLFIFIAATFEIRINFYFSMKVYHWEFAGALALAWSHTYYEWWFVLQACAATLTFYTNAKNLNSGPYPVCGTSTLPPEPSPWPHFTVIETEASLALLSNSFRSAAYPALGYFRAAGCQLSSNSFPDFDLLLTNTIIQGSLRYKKEDQWQ